MCRYFRTSCPFFIGGIGKKNYWDEIARLFIQVKVWLKNGLSQSEGGGTGRPRVQVEKQAVVGKDPKLRLVVSM
jgi:hypothetical protein